LGQHPWVYAGFIARVDGKPPDGALVSVHQEDGSFIAWGFFNSNSNIRVRLYSWNEAEVPDGDWLASRISRAVELRHGILGLGDPEGACRLIHSEGDGLSGLTVDRYASYLSVQVTSLALAQRLPEVFEILQQAARPQGIRLSSTPSYWEKEGIHIEAPVEKGNVPGEPILVTCGGLTWEVQFRGGQKTGFYLDQRENWEAAARLARGRSVLDLFCFSGGFSLTCARGGAKDVVGVDSSEPAVDSARRNAQRNGLGHATFVRSDVFEYLKDPSTPLFDMVVLDPPKFVPTRAAKDAGLRKYFLANRLALRRLKPGGAWVSCSCSGALSPDEFLGLLQSVERSEGRGLQILEERGAARDHPVNAHCPETRYLKCVIARVG
jgi:23S rRNA (cytosine1962-C5)-methyltransferase